jgi:adenylate kinase
MRIVLLGPQGSGKGTQEQRLARLTGAWQIASGDLVCVEIAAGTALGRQPQAYNDRSALVPDQVILGLALPRVVEANSWILDSFPRTEVQAKP